MFSCESHRSSNRRLCSGLLCLLIIAIGASCKSKQNGASTPSDYSCDAGGQYVEQREATNNSFASPDASTAEATGLSIGAGGAPLSIGGCVASTQSNAVEADGDLFEFTVRSKVRVRAQLSWNSDAYPSHHAVALLALSMDAGGVVAWWSQGNRGSLSTRPVELAPGVYRAHVTATTPAPTAPYPYVLQIAEDTYQCDAGAQSASYTEADETDAGNNRNDKAFLTTPAFLLAAATDAGDAPELTAQTVGLNTAVVLAGTSGAYPLATLPDGGAEGGVYYLDGGAYLDRDTFEITTGAGVTRLGAVVDFADADFDLDLFVFAADDVTKLIGTASAILERRDEAVVTVSPNTRYWVTIATRDERRIGGNTLHPQPYRVTLCGR